MIDTTEGVKPGDLYRDERDGAFYVVDTVSPSPVVELHDVRTGERLSGMAGCRNLAGLVPFSGELPAAAMARGPGAGGVLRAIQALAELGPGNLDAAGFSALVQLRFWCEHVAASCGVKTTGRLAGLVHPEAFDAAEHFPRDLATRPHGLSATPTPNRASLPDVLRGPNRDEAIAKLRQAAAATVAFADDLATVTEPLPDVLRGPNRDEAIAKLRQAAAATLAFADDLATATESLPDDDGEPIDTTNDCLVSMSVRAGEIVIQRYRALLPPDQAVRLAAWIVAITATEDRDFARLLRAIRTT